MIYDYFMFIFLLLFILCMSDILKFYKLLESPQLTSISVAEQILSNNKNLGKIIII